MDTKIFFLWLSTLSSQGIVHCVIQWLHKSVVCDPWSLVSVLCYVSINSLIRCPTNAQHVCGSYVRARPVNNMWSILKSIWNQSHCISSYPGEKNWGYLTYKNSGFLGEIWTSVHDPSIILDWLGWGFLSIVWSHTHNFVYTIKLKFLLNIS